MKRSVAIKGPTPAFLRWAIEHPCALRPIDEHRFVDRTFRSLRNLRELSNAIAEGRVVEDFCLHPTTWQTPETLNTVHDSVASAPPSTPPEDEVLGFGIEEIAAPFQGVDAIENACHSCPANVCRTSLGHDWRSLQDRSNHADQVEIQNEVDASGQFVGCYGFLSRHGFSLDRLLSGHLTKYQQQQTFDLMSTFAQFAAATLPVEKFWAAFPLGANFKKQSQSSSVSGYPEQAWLLPWCTPASAKEKEVRLEPDQIKILGTIFQAMLDDESLAVALPIEVRQFHAALVACRDFKMPLVGQWIPAGFSDGQTWRLNVNCEVCGFEPNRTAANHDDKLLDSPCGVCGSNTPLSQGLKFKVLGTRPYMHLSKIIGPAGVQMLRDRLS